MPEWQPPSNKTIDPANAIREAYGFHQQGRLAEAEQIYTNILAARPRYLDALHLLGVLKYQAGEYTEALRLIEAALRQKPKAPEVYRNHGLVLRALTRHQNAVASFNRALALRPDYPDALFDRGIALQALNRNQEALASFDRVLALKPDHTSAFNSRGVALAMLGREEEALASFERAIALDPGHADAHYNCGNALGALERHEDALGAYDKALKFKPDFADALTNRGNSLQALARYSEALADYDQALALQPDNAITLNNCGNVLQALMRCEEALVAYDRALALAPDHVEIRCGRANALQSMNRHDEAVHCYDATLALNPNHVLALRNRGGSLHLMNRYQEALECYDTALRLAPNDPEIMFVACMAELPVLYLDEPEIARQRTAYEQRLDVLCHTVDHAPMPAKFAKAVGSSQPFYLGYQGYNNRDLQQRYGSLVCRIMAARFPQAALPAPPQRHEPVRVGIVSGYFRNHSVWKVPTRGWLKMLDRRQFRLFGYHTGTEQDVDTREAALLCERFVQGPLSTAQWRAEILSDEPHVLIYPEIGMNSASAPLAAQRLAPIQCISLGHPDTSGFPTLDYFLSSDGMEPPDGEAHYTERLVRLPNLSIYYEPLDTPPPLQRTEFGLRADATVFWCGQSLYKYLPQFDHVFPHIARGVGNCQFLFIEFQKGQHITEAFRKRLQGAFAACGLRADDYCVVLPRLSQQKFIAATGLADIFLDSIGWSGFNSTLESLPHDLPIVTRKGPLMRGCHSTAVLQMMGMTETITETVNDYVLTAVRLAKDVAWRRSVSDSIAANKHRVYRDTASIVALEDFLDHAARTGGGR
jgi:protein O-GlcNAc transferase